jgi:outer membrane protein, multidrug efflux system
MRHLLFFIFLISLSGCRGMIHPKVGLPCEFSEAQRVESVEGPPVDLRVYWEQFEDPVLNELVDIALKKNYDLNIAREKICQARAEFGVEFAKLFPFIDANVQFQREGNPETTAISPFLGGLFVNFYRMGFDMAWEIDIFGKLRSGAKAGCLNIRAREEEVRYVNLTVSSEVAARYFEIRNLQERIGITKWHIKSTQELIDIASARLEGGFTGELDVVTSKALNDTRRAKLNELESDLEQTIYAVAVLLGEIPECLKGAFEDGVPVPTAKGRIPLGLPSELICRRGDVRDAYYAMKTAGAEVLVARQELFPRLDLASLFEYSTSFFTRWLGFFSKNWVYQPSLTLPLFHGRQLMENILVKTSIQRQRVMEYERAVIDALAEVEKSIVAYYMEERRFENLTKERDNYRNAREIALVLYTAGLQDFVYVFNIEQNLYAAELQWSESRERLGTSLVAVYKSLGGGWEEC